MGRYALLIGNSNYTAGLDPLPSAVLDVAALRDVLVDSEIGCFDASNVTVLQDARKDAIETAIHNLFANRKNDDLLLFYFSGHGVTDSGGNFYFSSVSTDKNALLPTAVSSGYVKNAMEQTGARSKRQILILDCCHSGAFPKEITKTKDSGTVHLLPKLGGEGRAILTASDSTQYAFMQEGFELSLYTHFLVEGLKTGAADRDGDGEISVDELYDYVREKVKNANDNMSPEYHPIKGEAHKIILAKAALDDPKLKFRKEVERIVKRNQGKLSAISKNLLRKKSQELKIESPESEIIIKEVLRPYIEYANKLKEYEETLQEAIDECFPFTEVMQADLKEYESHLGLRETDIIAIVEKIIRPKELELNQSPQVIEIIEQKIETENLTYQQKDEQNICFNLGNNQVIEFVQIPAGKFMMGSDVSSYEKPIHEVKIQSFWLEKYTVTNAQWEAVMGTKGSDNCDVKFQGKNQPVVGVSWDNCKEFCERISQQIGKNVRLPSEAEWEYACRAGTTTAFHFGETITPDLVNYDGNFPYGDAPKGEYRKKTVNVDTFNPNPWGLYQMHGNVWEWCEDVWHEDYNNAPTDGTAWLNGGEQTKRVLRGGSWYSYASDCRSAYRLRSDADLWYDYVGFRVVFS